MLMILLCILRVMESDLGFKQGSDVVIVIKKANSLWCENG